ncbi:MAG: potassium channel protein [Planctomycetota bacterium]
MPVTFTHHRRPRLADAVRRNAAFQNRRDDEQTMAVVRCLSVALAVVLIGSLGFHLIETQWSWWQSFYFTLVTISTVGYGDDGLSEDGKKFAAFMLLCGIGTFTYSLSTLVQIASDVDAAMRRKMRRKIAECTDHVVVCGYGRIGRMICDEIERGGVGCVVVERDPGGVQQAMGDNRLVVQGVASEDETLLAAGIERAQAVVCAVDSDAENMFITVSAGELNPAARIISRAESPDAARKLERAGASLVVSPHQMAGKTIATALVHPRLTKFLHSSAGGGDGEPGVCCFELGEVVVDAASNAAGKTVRELGGLLRGLVFVAVERADGELVFQPPGDLRFFGGDVVIFAGAGDVVHHMRTQAAPTKRPEPAVV